MANLIGHEAGNGGHRQGNPTGEAPPSPTRRLIRRLDLSNKLSSFDVRGLYLTNVDIDSNGKAYLVLIQETGIN
jgi:hypothetical protein